MPQRIQVSDIWFVQFGYNASFDSTAFYGPTAREDAEAEAERCNVEMKTDPSPLMRGSNLRYKAVNFWDVESDVRCDAMFRAENPEY